MNKDKIKEMYLAQFNVAPDNELLNFCGKLLLIQAEESFTAGSIFDSAQHQSLNKSQYLQTLKKELE